MTDPHLQTWDDYIGQEAMKERLRLTLDACILQERPLPHILLVAPPGTGKTTLARLIADSWLRRLECHIAPINDRLLRATLMCHEGGVLFIDEIHNLSKRQQEFLLPVLSEGYAEDERGNRYEVDPFTCIIGATTEGDKIIRPLWDRFPIKPTFEAYTDDEMTLITYNLAHSYDLPVTMGWAQTISRAALGVPRNARSVVEFARDLSDVEGGIPEAHDVLARAQISPEGFTRQHIMYLEALNANGGKAGLKTLQQLLGMPPGHVENLEIDLMKHGILERASGGRELTHKGIRMMRKNNNDQ